MQGLIGGFLGGRAGVGLLLLRLVMGLGIIMHGWSKIQKPFSWMDKPDKPSPIPDVLQALAAFGEVGGGLGLMVGFLTPIAAFGVLATMVGAYFISHRGDPWIDPKADRTWELASLYFIMAFTLLMTGPGRFSLDALFFGGPSRVPEDRLADITPPDDYPPNTDKL